MSKMDGVETLSCFDGFEWQGIIFKKCVAKRIVPQEQRLCVCSPWLPSYFRGSPLPCLPEGDWSRALHTLHATQDC